MKYCSDLEISLKDGPHQDIDALELHEELKTLTQYLPENCFTAYQVLEYLHRSEAYPNTNIALKILLTTPVTVASAERSFSKLKLIKNYLRNTISQERLSGLSMISVENEIGKEVDYSKIITDFAAIKARKAIF